MNKPPKNPVSGKLTRLAKIEQFAAMFQDMTQQARLIQKYRAPNVLGVMCFTVLDERSPHFGHQTAVFYGPSLRNKTAHELAKKHFQHKEQGRQFPTVYCEKTNGTL